MGKTKEDWNGLKLGFLKTVQPNSFSKLIPAACNFKKNACNFFAYIKFYSDWERVIGKIKQDELDCRDTAPLSFTNNYITPLVTRWQETLLGHNLWKSKRAICWAFVSRADLTEIDGW